jgi:outer membrane lipoprotein-sorting protein
LRILLKRGLPVLVAILSICSGPKRSESACTAETVVAQIRQWAQSIDTYRVKTQVEFNGQSLSGNVWGDTKQRMRLELKLLGEARPTRWILVFDGRYQWLETQAGRLHEVARVDLSTVARPERPFDTRLEVYGSGLAAGDDFPGTIRWLLSVYDYRVDCKADVNVLRGTINKERLAEWMRRRAIKWSEDESQSFSALFGVSTVDASPSGAVMGYSAGPRGGSATISVKFLDLVINQRLESAVFKFNPPSHVRVTDVTKQVAAVNPPRKSPP